ncbi:hypothetical protein Tco_0692739, partial [Tanacetum coccineum]
MAATIITAVP